MLTITDIGHFACDACKSGRPKKGVELQSYGYCTRPQAEDVPATTDGAAGRRVIHLNLKVWREPLHLCLDCLKGYVAEMIDDGSIGLWMVHTQAAMRPDYVNATYEEAVAKGWI